MSGVTPLGTSQGADLATVVNEFQAELVKDHPDRFGVFAVVPLPDVAASLTAIAYDYGVLNPDGSVPLGNWTGVYLGDPALDEVVEELDRPDCPLSRSHGFTTTTVKPSSKRIAPEARGR